MTNLIPAADTLYALEGEALFLAKTNPRAPQKQRTTAVPVGEHITLHAIALYPDDVELALLIRSTSTAEKSVYASQLTARVVWRCFWRGHEVSLTREGAFQLLTVGHLPEDVKDRLRATDAATAAQVAIDAGAAALFDSLNRAGETRKALEYGPDGRPVYEPYNAGGVRRPSATRLLPPSGRTRAEIQKAMYG